MEGTPLPIFLSLCWPPSDLSAHSLKRLARPGLLLSLTNLPPWPHGPRVLHCTSEHRLWLCCGTASKRTILHRMPCPPPFRSLSIRCKGSSISLLRSLMGPEPVCKEGDVFQCQPGDEFQHRPGGGGLDVVGMQGWKFCSMIGLEWVSGAMLKFVHLQKLGLISPSDI